MIKNLPAVQETQVQFSDQKDPLEKGMATRSSILAWRIPCTEEFGGYSPCSCKESDMSERLTFTHLTCLVYNIVLVSSVQQIHSVIHSIIYTYVCIHI